MNKKVLSSMFAALVATGCVCTQTDAHGVFFANRTDEKVLVLGEGPVDNAYSSDMVKSIKGYDTMGMEIPLKVVKHEKNIAIVPTDNLGVTTTYFDYGYWTKDKDGNTVHQKITEVPGATKSTHALKYDVHYWSKDAKPLVNSSAFIQIVPSVNPLTLKKGDTFEIQVLKDGKPYANAPLIRDLINDMTGESMADENGKATITVASDGLNVVGVEVAFPTDVKGEQNKYFSALSFIIYPEE
ncbi:DUF4198 domain-containing protein [Veillonella caviae]|uniref:DUF4198 domain-containing protein n=1 Tax=Veillonella caviae TaxID=248316 RepID=UPI002A908C79|nr:DUF4198 domain-containing protein [Veillonella caviae]MDD7290817.1 DUF4198 domain-containing protein [Veillonella caviae]MDY5787463.1 DUF4198 domain-containing protein [Veillonella caviae]